MHIVESLRKHPKRSALIIIVLSAIIAGIITGVKARKEKKIAEAQARAMHGGGGDVKVTLNAGAVLKDVGLTFIVLVVVMYIFVFVVERVGRKSDVFRQGAYGQYQPRI